jgi:16S rRNA processing protein RimM
MPAARVLVGRFGAPHGVRGEVRLRAFTADPQAIKAYRPLSDEAGRPLAITALRHLKDDMFVARLADVTTRDAAQALTHRDIFVARDALPPAEEEEYYHADLIGLAAMDSAGARIGTVTAVHNHGGGDILEVSLESDGDTLLLPFTRAVVPTIDVAGGRLLVVPPDEVEANPLPEVEAGR